MEKYYIQQWGWFVLVLYNNPKDIKYIYSDAPITELEEKDWGKDIQEIHNIINKEYGTEI